jgi:hypothetical protein
LAAVARIPLSPVKLLGEGDHNIRGAATASLGAMAAAAPIVVEWGREFVAVASICAPSSVWAKLQGSILQLTLSHMVILVIY